VGTNNFSMVVKTTKAMMMMMMMMKKNNFGPEVDEVRENQKELH
jgi:hypothetical protein